MILQGLTPDEGASAGASAGELKSNGSHRGQPAFHGGIIEPVSVVALGQFIVILNYSACPGVGFVAIGTGAVLVQMLWHSPPQGTGAAKLLRSKPKCVQ